MTKTKLLEAQKTTEQLFETVVQLGLISPGKTDQQLSAEVTRLALDKFGIRDHWHKKIVRTGANTLAKYSEDPPARMIAEDDILFIDFGPIVNEYEADLGRTYVLGNDPVKQKLKADVERAWYETQAWVRQHRQLEASALFNYAGRKAREYGWTWCGDIAGHIVGKFPHEQPADPASPALDIHPANHDNIFLRDADGNERHWILELQFVDPVRKIGGYFEQLL